MGIDLEASAAGEAGGHVRGQSRMMAFGHRVQPQGNGKAGPEQDGQERLQPMPDQRTFAPGRRHEHPERAAGRSRRSPAGQILQQGVQPAIAMRHQVLGFQTVDFLGAPDLPFMVRADTEKGVIGIEGMRPVHPVNAGDRMEDVEIMHGVRGPFQRELFQVAQRHDKGVRLDGAEQGRARTSGADKERMGLLPGGILGIRTDPDQGLAAAFQRLGHRVEIRPVGRSLGIKNDPFLGGGQEIESAQADPCLAVAAPIIQKALQHDSRIGSKRRRL